VNATCTLKERILAEVALVPSLTRGQGRRLSHVLFAVSAIVTIALFELVGGLSHASERPLVVTVRLADGWALGSAAITWMVARQLARPATAPRLLFVATLACPVVLFAWMGRFDGNGAAGTNGPWACFACSVAFATPSFVSFFVVCRGCEPEYPHVLGAGAGAACAAWGGVLGLLWCPVTSGWHALAGHVAPIAALTAVGSMAGRAVLGLPSSPKSFERAARWAQSALSEVALRRISKRGEGSRIDRSAAEDDAATAVDDQRCRDAPLPERIREREVGVDKHAVMNGAVARECGDRRSRLTDGDGENDGALLLGERIEAVERLHFGDA